MTQTTSRHAAVPPTRGPSGQVLPAAATVLPAGDGRARRRALLETLFEGSPGRLRLAGIGAVVACLVFGLLGALAFQARGNALSDAKADAAQLVRVQQISTEVVRADSLLTSAFPSGSHESATQLTQFHGALSNAARLVAEAAAANPADAADLAQVGDGLQQYIEYATNARLANQAQKQVSFGYLRQAGAALRGQDSNNPNLITGQGMLPALNALTAANSKRVDDAYTASQWATLELVLADLVALGGLIGVQVWVARRTRRYLNVPLAAASAGVLVVLLVGAVVMVSAQSRADNVRATSYTSLKALADARIAAYGAKSDASIAFLYLRTGGSSATYTTDYANKTAAVTRALGAAGSAAGQDATDSFSSWKTAADGLLAPAAASNWVKLSQGLVEDNNAFNAPFATLDTVLSNGITAQKKDVDTTLGSGNLPLVIVGWLTLVVGVLAAIAAWAGISQRLEDYR